MEKRIEADEGRGEERQREKKMGGGVGEAGERCRLGFSPQEVRIPFGSVTFAVTGSCQQGQTQTTCMSMHTHTHAHKCACMILAHHPGVVLCTPAWERRPVFDGKVKTERTEAQG